MKADVCVGGGGGLSELLLSPFSIHNISQDAARIEGFHATSSMCALECQVLEMSAELQGSIPTHHIHSW